MTVHSLLILTVLLTGLFFSGCVYRLTNRERVVSTEPRTLYLQPVNDTTARSGQAAKLMSSLRRLLAQDNAFVLTDIKSARWGLNVQITDAARSISRVERCDQGNEVLAAGAIPCSKVAASKNLPDISAEEEIAQMSVDARAVDLETGAVLFQIRLPNLTTGAYQIVGDATVRSSLSQSPGLHVLRSMENSDVAIESLAKTAADRIYEQLIALPPPSPSL